MKYVIFQIKISLRHSDPLIWRRILVHKSDTLSDFHELIQGVMGWEFAHMHEFYKEQKRGRGRRSGLQSIENEDRTRLKDVLQKPKDSMLYEYDFGDGWRHDIVLEKVHQIDPDGIYPWILEGSGACPPEDSGGIHGYYHKLAALADPKHDDHEWASEWLGEDFDPEFFDPGEFNGWKQEVHQHHNSQSMAGAEGESNAQDEDGDSGENASLVFDDDDFTLIESLLGRIVDHDGYRLDVSIYRSDESDWHLEVVNEAGTSIVWDDTFETDQLAWEEFERCLEEEGIEAFK